MTADEIISVKHAIRERDGFACVECGMSNDDHTELHGKQLEVHRITPGSVYSLEAGVCETLCFQCHLLKPKSPRGSLPKKTGYVVRVRDRTLTRL